MKHLIVLSCAVAALSSQGLGLFQLPAAPAVEQPQVAPTYKHVNAQGAEKLLQENKGVVVLDVRTPEEYAGGHIAGAKNIDFLDDGFEKNLKGLDKNQTYLVHCAVGSRSTQSLDQFKALGFKSVYHLDGGFSGWKRAGKPVVK